MSLELVDCRFKIHPVTLAILKGVAKSRNTTVADLLRLMADREAAEYTTALSEIEKLLSAQGLLGELRGFDGRYAARATDGGVDLDGAE